MPSRCESFSIVPARNAAGNPLRGGGPGYTVSRRSQSDPRMVVPRDIWFFSSSCRSTAHDKDRSVSANRPYAAAHGIRRECSQCRQTAPTLAVVIGLEEKAPRTGRVCASCLRPVDLSGGVPCSPVLLFDRVCPEHRHSTAKRPINEERPLPRFPYHAADDLEATAAQSQPSHLDSPCPSPFRPPAGAVIAPRTCALPGRSRPAHL